MKTLAIIIGAAVALLPLFSGTGLGAESITPETGVSIKANGLSHNQADDIVTAEGDVFITWQGMTLMAMKADYNRQTQIITASGNVVLIKDGDIVRGSSLSFDTTSGKGEIENSTIHIRKGNIHVAGKKILKTGENEYAAEHGSYTTCDAENPSWKFGTSSLDVNIDEYGTGTHAVFYIKDIPLLYFPYIIFPGKRDRQSGFLYPRFSYSSIKGAEADIFYYWAISPSQEATIDLDVQTKRGVGTGLDYRYLRKQGSTGNLGGYMIYDTTTSSFRGLLTQAHQEIFSPDMNLRTSVNATTDREFLTDYGEKSGVYNRQSSDSTVNFLKTWQHHALTAKLRYTQDYYAASNTSTLQTLPEIGLAAVRQQILSTPLYFDLDSTASNFYRETGPNGQRLYAFPRLTLISGQPGVFSASAYVGTHLRAYNSYNLPSGSDIKTTDGRQLAETGAELSTSLSRVYDIGGEKLQKVRHELVPGLRYIYSQDVDQSRLPSYDYLDRIVFQNTLYYSLTSFLGGKFRQGETTEYRDLMRLRLSQGYTFEGRRPELLTMVDTGRHLTDLMLESETWLHPNVKVALDGRYNVYGNYISSIAPGIELDDKRGSSLSVGYRMSDNDVEYLEGRMSTQMLAPWTFSYATRYSLDRQNFLESVYTVEYRHQCWSILLSYLDRRVINPSNDFTFSFNLLGAFAFGTTQKLF
jgi:LPS-assembly protein